MCSLQSVGITHCVGASTSSHINMLTAFMSPACPPWNNTHLIVVPMWPTCPLLMHSSPSAHQSGSGSVSRRRPPHTLDLSSVRSRGLVNTALTRRDRGSIYRRNRSIERPCGHGCSHNSPVLMRWNCFWRQTHWYNGVLGLLQLSDSLTLGQSFHLHRPSSVFVLRPLSHWNRHIQEMDPCLFFTGSCHWLFPCCSL